MGESNGVSLLVRLAAGQIISNKIGPGNPVKLKLVEEYRIIPCQCNQINFNVQVGEVQRLHQSGHPSDAIT